MTKMTVPDIIPRWLLLTPDTDEDMPMNQNTTRKPVLIGTGTEA